MTELTDLVEKDLAEAALSKQTNFPRSNFESQYKYLPKLPANFLPSVAKPSDSMDIDEVNGKKIVVYTFDQYMALNN